VKLLGIGELFIPHQHIRRGFAGFVEKEGSGAYDPPEYIREAVRDADIIVTEFCPIGKALIDECANLAVIGVLRAGTTVGRTDGGSASTPIRDPSPICRARLSESSALARSDGRSPGGSRASTCGSWPTIPS